MEQYDFTVEGMSCTGCEETVSTAIRRVEGVHRVEAEHETGVVVITADGGMNPT
jgi:copper chaperone